jgi:hypothetical protein
VAIRVDREVFDAIGAGSTSGGLRVYEDGTRNAPWQPAPFASSTETIVSNTLRLMAVPADAIRQITPPPPAGGLFPPQFGYDTTPLTIEDVLNTDRWAPKRRSFVAPTSTGPLRLERDAESMWEGSFRGVNTSNPNAV